MSNGNQWGKTGQMSPLTKKYRNSKKSSFSKVAIIPIARVGLFCDVYFINGLRGNSTDQGTVSMDFQLNADQNHLSLQEDRDENFEQNKIDRKSM